VGVVLFNLILIICTLPPYIVAKVSVFFTYCRPFRPTSTRPKVVLVLTCLCWRLLFTLAFWIRIRADGLSDLRQHLGSSGRPVVVVANHLSFLDTLLLVAMMPVSRMSRMKMFVSEHLLKMPILSTIVQAMGHIAVPFKPGAGHNDFELDRELMAIRQLELEEHVRSGGYAGWFPEGRMNPGDSTEVGLFRAGGFALACHVDVEVWTIAFFGNGMCWPRTSAAGGRPSKIGVKFERLCESSWEFVSTAKGGPGLNDEKEACKHLANHAHERVQTGITQLFTEGIPAYQGGRKAKAREVAINQPLLSSAA